jgi:hypothetical protein
MDDSRVVERDRLLKDFLGRVQSHAGCLRYVWYKIPKLTQKPWASTSPVDDHASSSELSFTLFSHLQGLIANNLPILGSKIPDNCRT